VLDRSARASWTLAEFSNDDQGVDLGLDLDEQRVAHVCCGVHHTLVLVRTTAATTTTTTTATRSPPRSTAGGDGDGGGGGARKGTRHELWGSGCNAHGEQRAWWLW
jgi:hypothetical protein